MFYVYFIILAVPLTVVIPYFAYHSLSSERQDRTYELVSITALHAGRILVGKLCGIGMQMIVYLSALFPCLAFTYLLRGLDIFTVFMVVAYTCLLSLGLAMLGLLLATLSSSRQRQIVQGVLFAGLLCYACGMLLAIVSGIIARQGSMLADAEFWQINIALALVYGNAFAIVFLSARAQLTMASQNRSTALRVALAIAALTAIGWFSWANFQWGDQGVYALLALCTLGWYASGVFMVGEPQVLSSRVRRGLPQSLPGRVLFTWFMPGPGTGYMFVMANMITLTVMCVLMTTDPFWEFGERLARITPGRRSSVAPFEVLGACIVATSYLAIYLGLTKLILAVVARFGDTRLTVRFLVGILLVLFGGGGPWVMQISNPRTRDLDYTLLQMSNPVWTLKEYCWNHGPPAGMDTWVLTVLPITALVVWGFNLPSLVRELLQSHLPQPARVVEDDAQQRRLATAGTGPTSPWES